MYIDGGRLTLENCAFRNNQARHGGAIYSRFTSLAITNCIVSDNSVGMHNYPGSGGGVECFATGTLTIVGSTFANNSAADGAGIRNTFSNSALINNCVFAGNYGAAISNGAGGTISVVDSTFEGNSGSAIANGVSLMHFLRTQIFQLSAVDSRTTRPEPAAQYLITPSDLLQRIPGDLQSLTFPTAFLIAILRLMAGRSTASRVVEPGGHRRA